MPATSHQRDRSRRGNARALAAEMSQAARRRARRRVWAWRVFAALIIAVVASVLTVALVAQRAANAPATTAGLAKVSGIGALAPPPWVAPADVPPRVAAAGLRLGRMGTAEHYHAHLDVLVNGRAVAVPANIGVDAASGSMSALHTHTPDGVLHIEADAKGQIFTLGQLFTEWNVRLTPTMIGSLPVADTKQLVVYVNGRRTEDPALLRLEPNQEIALMFGTPEDIRDVPKSFDFSGV